MSIWTLLQVAFNLVLTVVCVSLWLRSRRPPQDDPRLSRGLQLLQTKITVLEDLSDRTENQVKQLSSMLDQKARILQNKVIEAEEQILKIDHSMNKSLEVAEIFQDKIPHNEILERQRTVEYVKAARMAHSGLGVDEIAKAVHLPREQVELIAKFNKDQLMFDESQLPGWANGEAPVDQPEVYGAGATANPAGFAAGPIPQPSSSFDSGSFSLGEIDFVGGLEKPRDPASSAKIENDFREAVQSMKQFEANPPAASILDTKVAHKVGEGVERVGETLQPAVMSLKATAHSLKEKLVASAEELLRQQTQSKTGTAGAAGTTAPRPAMTVDSSTTVSKVLGASTRANPTAPASNDPTAKAVLSSKPVVKKVIFPRIEK